MGEEITHRITVDVLGNVLLLAFLVCFRDKYRIDQASEYFFLINKLPSFEINIHVHLYYQYIFIVSDIYFNDSMSLNVK
jgi:hypothetical protein